MSSLPDNYTPPASRQNVQPYTPPLETNNTLVDKHIPYLESSWKRADKARLAPAPSSLRSLEIHKGLEEGLIQRELVKVREEFLIEARKIQTEKMILLDAQYEAKIKRVDEEYHKLFREQETKLSKKDEELDRYYRIINIQTEILTRLYEQNKEVFYKILEDAGIDLNDLSALTNGARSRD